MKHLYILIFLVTFDGSVYSQNKEVLKTNVVSDTTKVVIQKSSKIPVSKEKDIEIILAKESTSNDNAKYLIPILTLILGFCLNKFYDIYINRSKIKKAGKRWIIELRNTESLIKRQMEELNIFSEVLKKDDTYEIDNLVVVSGVEGEIFKSFDKVEIYKFIELRNRAPFYKSFFFNKEEKLEEDDMIAKISNNVHSQTNIQINLHKLIQKRWDSYLSETSRYTTEFKKDIRQFNLAMKDLSIRLIKDGINIETDTQFKPIKDLYMAKLGPSLQNRESPDPFALDSSFFTPMVKELVPFTLDERFVPISLTVINCLNDILELRAERTYMLKNIETLNKFYQEQLDNINPLIDKMLGKKE